MFNIRLKHKTQPRKLQVEIPILNIFAQDLIFIKLIVILLNPWNIYEIPCFVKGARKFLEYYLCGLD